MTTATHLVKVSYYVSHELEHSTPEKVRQLEKMKWTALLGDALENIEVENLKE